MQNRHAEEQKAHWDKQTKGIYTFKINGNFLCLNCPSTTFALKCFGLVPREWLDAKGLLGKQNIQAKKVFRVEFPAEKKTLIFFTNFVPFTGKNNGFPFLDFLGYLKNTHKNPKFGKVRQVPTGEFPTKFPDWDLSHSSKFGIFVGIL